MSDDNLLKPSPQIVIELLQSIRQISVEDGELEVWFDDDPYSSVIQEFIPGSFTRDLLVLIENFLLPEEELAEGSSTTGAIENGSNPFISPERLDGKI